MAVEIIPDEVIRSEELVLCADAEVLLDRLQALACSLSDSKASGSVQQLDKGMEMARRLCLELPDSSIAVQLPTGLSLPDGPHAERDGDKGIPIGRSKLLLGSWNVRVGLWLRFFAGLCCSSMVQSALKGVIGLPEETVDAIGFASEGLTLAWGSPSISELKKSVNKIPAGDYPLVRMAVRLSCGNVFGFAVHTKPVTALSLMEACLASDGDDLQDSPDSVAFDYVSELIGAERMADPDVETATQGISEAIAMIAKRYEVLTSEAIDYSLSLKSGSTDEQLKRCASVLKRLEEIGMFRQEGHVGKLKAYRYNV